MLTYTKLKNLKPRDKLYKVSDRDGLYVAVAKFGTVPVCSKEKDYGDVSSRT